MDRLDRWYCLSADGCATLCKDEADARTVAADCDIGYRAGSPHRAVQLVDVASVREATQRAAAELQTCRYDLSLCRSRCGSISASLQLKRTGYEREIRDLVEAVRDANASAATGLLLTAAQQDAWDQLMGALK